LRISIVLADANILYSRTLRDYVLYAADEGAIEIHWSQDILDEMSRNLQENLGLSRDDTTRLEELMNDYIEYALIDVDRADLATVEHVEMDARDRHVLAAAISADADVLLTENTKHFPRDWMVHHGIGLMDAGELLLRLALRFPDKVRRAHDKVVRYSPKPEAEVLATLEGIVGEDAANAVRSVLQSPSPPRPAEDAADN
jgi:predicted nucleic acid-binding protein